MPRIIIICLGLKNNNIIGPGRGNNNVLSLEPRNNNFICPGPRNNNVICPDFRNNNVICLRPSDKSITYPGLRNNSITCLGLRNNSITCPDPRINKIISLCLSDNNVICPGTMNNSVICLGPSNWVLGKSYLSGRLFFICVEQSLVSVTQASSCVSQGSIYWPILFTKYISPIRCLIDSYGGNLFKYADDTHFTLTWP